MTLDASTVLRPQGTWTITRPDPGDGCGDAPLGSVNTVTMETVTDFEHEATFSVLEDSSNNTWLASRSFDIAYRGGVRFTGVNTAQPAYAPVTYADVLILANTTTGRFVFAFNRSGTQWSVLRALMWGTAVISDSVELTPVEFDGHFAVVTPEGPALVPLDDAVALESDAKVAELHAMGIDLAALTGSGTYKPAGDPAACEPEQTQAYTVRLADPPSGPSDEPAGPGSANPLLNADGTLRVVPTPEGSSSRATAAVVSTRQLGATAGARRHASKLHNRPRSIVTVAVSKADPDETEAVRELVEVTRGGAAPTRYRTWLDPTIAATDPVRSSPLYRLTNTAEVLRALGDHRASVTLELERLTDDPPAE